MNYFITTFTGKHPIQLNDFEHLQQAYLEGFDAICKTLLPEGTTAAVLNGCVLEIDEVNLTFSVSEGFVYHEGEIYFMPGAEGEFEEGQLPYLSIVESYADFNPVLYKDGQERNVHQIRIMAFSFQEAGADGLPFEDDDFSGFSTMALDGEEEIPGEEETPTEEEETPTDGEEEETPGEEEEPELSNFIDFLNVERVEDLFLEKLGLTESTEQIATLEEDMAIAQEDIADLQDRLDSAETDITDLQDRLDSAETDITDLQDRLDDAETRLDELEPIAAILQGSPILMIDSDSISYFGIDGLGTDIWENWALCDGRNFTPDLRGKFIAGYDPDNVEYDLEQEGGEETVILDETEMPVHVHEYVDKYALNEDVATGSSRTRASSVTEDTIETYSAGGLLVDEVNEVYETQAHENRPPYYVLAFVKKIA